MDRLDNDISKINKIVYRAKGLIRFARFHMRLGVRWEAYPEPGNVDFYLGYYKARGRVIVFKDRDGKNVFIW